MRVKRSLSAPIKKLSSCVSGLKGRRLRAKRSNRYRRGRGGRGGGGRGGGGVGGNRSGRTPPPSQRNPQPVILCSYQADLEKQRQVDNINEKRHRRLKWFTMTSKDVSRPKFQDLLVPFMQAKQRDSLRSLSGFIHGKKIEKIEIC